MIGELVAFAPLHPPGKRGLFPLKKLLAWDKGIPEQDWANGQQILQNKGYQSELWNINCGKTPWPFCHGSARATTFSQRVTLVDEKWVPGSLGRTISLMVLFLGACFASPAIVRAGPIGPKSTLSVDQLIDGLSDTFARLRKLPGLEVDYRMTNERLEKKSVESWVYDWGELTNGIKPEQPGKVKLRFYFPENQNGTIVLVERSFSSDRELKAQCSTGNKISRAAIWSLAKEPRNPNYMFFYYFRFLGYPVGPDPDVGQALRRVYPENTYWLPEALRKNREAYRVKDHLEKVDGVWCHVLERPGWDTLWLQTKPTIAMRRRAFTWGPGKPLRHVATFLDLREEAPGLWLPRTIVFDKYTAPWDEAPLVGKVAGRLRLVVSKISVRDLPDSYFKLQIPKGAEVQDFVNGEANNPIYFINQEGADPFDRVITGQKQTQQRQFWVFLISGFVVVFITLLFFYQRRKRGAASGSGKPEEP